MDDDPYRVNLRRWNERATFHLRTKMYREFVDRLRRGDDALLPFDDAVLGDLSGHDVLHLQCHVGTDTLSLARRGATVTGVDFSSSALDQARTLASELGIAATFVESDVYGLRERLQDDFDLVYTSYGVLCWLGDLGRWAEVAASFLRPGGRLVLIEAHPLATAIAEDEAVDGEVLRLDWPCLGQPGPIHLRAPGSYADRDAPTEHDESREWAHGLGEIVQAVLDAGLVVERLQEHPEHFCECVPGMTRGRDRLWRLPEPLHGRFPLTFTLVARRPLLESPP